MTKPEMSPWQVILEKHAPQLLKQATGLQETVTGDGALSAKTKTLMMLLCDALLAHPEGVAHFGKQARARKRAYQDGLAVGVAAGIAAGAAAY